MPYKSEAQLQALCYRWFWNSFPHLRRTLFHIPNGGQRPDKEGWKFKATGVVAGVSDLAFCYQGQIFFIELKLSNGRLSSSQQEFLNCMHRQQINTYIVRDLETFKELINYIIACTPTSNSITKSCYDYTHHTSYTPT